MLSTNLDWEHVGRVREMVRALPAEEQRQGARLVERCYVLSDAIRDLSGERPLRNAERWKDVLEGLEELKEEAEAAFRTFREERGIPDVTEGGA